MCARAQKSCLHVHRSGTWQLASKSFTLPDSKEKVHCCQEFQELDLPKQQNVRCFRHYDVSTMQGKVACNSGGSSCLLRIELSHCSVIDNPTASFLVLQVPFKQYDGHQAAVMATYKGIRPEIPKDTPEKLSQLIRECWSPAYGQRPSFAEIVPRLQRLHDSLSVSKLPLSHAVQAISAGL